MILICIWVWLTICIRHVASSSSRRSSGFVKVKLLSVAIDLNLSPSRGIYFSDWFCCQLTTAGKISALKLTKILPPNKKLADFITSPLPSLHNTRHPPSSLSILLHLLLQLFLICDTMPFPPLVAHTFGLAGHLDVSGHSGRDALED